MAVWRPRHSLVFPVLAVVLLLASGLGCIVDYRLSGDAQSVTVRVAADQAWTDTGVDVAPGEQVVIEYVGGLWWPWPGGSYDALGSGGDPHCDCNQIMGVSHAALIGRVGKGEPFLVGNRWVSVMGEGGRLFLGINDTRLDDNSGYLQIRVRTKL